MADDFNFILNELSSAVVKIDSFEAPTDRDTFQKRQKELVDELRRNQRAAKEIMHSYRADDKHLLSEIRKASLKETNTPGRLLNAPTTPAYFTMAEIDQLQRLRKEIAAWRNERHRSFEDGHIVEPESEEQELASLDEESWFDIKTVRTIFDRRKSVDEALKSPLPESPRSLVPGKEGEDTDHTVSNTENAVYCLSTEEDRFVVSTAAKDELSDPNCVNFQVQKSEDVEENSDIESSESLGRRVDVEEAVTMESENPYEDSIRSESKEAHADDPSEDDIRSTSERFLQSEVTRRSKVVPRLLENDDSYASVKTPTNSRSIRPISVSTTAKTRISMSSRTLSPQGKRLFHASQQNNGSTRRTKDANLVQDENEDPPSSPNTTTDQLAKNVVLKRVPLYCRRPTIGPKKETSAVCQGRYIPNLHVQRDGCERCLYWASAKEKEKFFERGHHLRIMMVRGGCGRNCTIFPRKADEFPVRLCKKCYFDTHRSSGLSNDGEEQLLWNQAASP